MTRAVFLDRDGVLNRAVIRDGKPYAPASPAEVSVAPEVAPGLARLKERGFLLIVVTNQPDVARGTTTLDKVEEINREVLRDLPIDDIFTCYHDDKDNCPCRKPKPGLILDAAAKWTVELSRSFMVGDRWRDVDAGAAAGCQTVWLNYGYRERGPSHPASATVADFREAVDWILSVP